MESIKQISLDETIEKLYQQRNVFFGQPVNVSKKIIDKIDELIIRTELLKGEKNLNEKILLNDLVELELNYGDDDIEHESYYLGLDFCEDTISIFSPLGYSIYGANVNDVVSYAVKDVNVTATIVSKNKIEEESKQLLLSDDRQLG